jgi:hypothetical protein
MNDPNSYMKIGQVQILPDNPVRIDGSWRSSVSAMGLTLFTRSTLEQVTTTADGDVAQISTKYYGTSGQAGSRLQNGAPKSYLSVTGTGITEFNITTGTQQSVTLTLVTDATFMALPTAKRNAAVVGPVKLHVTAHIREELIGTDARM